MIDELSIGVVTYNSRDEIEKFIKSLELIIDSIKVRKLSLYVLDNGSTDNTVSYVQKVVPSGFEIKVFAPDKNLGFGGGHNFILKRLTSQIHVISNPDITFKNENVFNDMIEKFDSMSDLGLYSPAIVDEYGEIQLLNKKNPTLLDMALRFTPDFFASKRKGYFLNQEDGYLSEQSIEFASGAFMGVRTDAMRAIGGFDERFFMYFEDADLSRNMYNQFATLYNPSVHVVHKWQRASHKSLKYFWIHVVSMYKYFSKWGWTWK